MNFIKLHSEGFETLEDDTWILKTTFRALLYIHWNSENRYMHLITETAATENSDGCVYVY